MTVKLERDMSMDPIIELRRKLKEARVDRETAVSISLMVREGDRRKQLMAWMEENPQATPTEICKKARALHG